MFGPKPRGHFTSSVGSAGFRVLLAGERYRVVAPFVDFDGDAHPVGETWVFLGHAFLPYEDGLSWFVSLDGEDEWHIRMRWTDDAQGPIVDALERHLARV